MVLNKKQIATFQEALLAMRRELTTHLGQTTAEVKTPEESKGYSQHQADEGTDDFERTIAIELTSKDMETLNKIDRALEKIEEGTYGVCDVTSKPIPIKRLEAVPYANMTIEAQEEYEQARRVRSY